MPTAMNMVMMAVSAASSRLNVVKFNPSGTQSAVSIDAFAPNAVFTIQTDGDYAINQVLDSGDWVESKANLDASNYEVRAVKVNGADLSGGTVGSWVSLDSNRSWNMTNPVDNTTRVGTYDFTVRQKSATTNADTLRVVFSAENTAGTIV